MQKDSLIQNTIIITMGDPNGIGPEIICKAILYLQMKSFSHPMIVFGHWPIFESVFQYTDTLDFLQISESFFSDEKIQPKLYFFETGFSGFSALEMAVKYIKAKSFPKSFHRLVTGPMSKRSFDGKFPGHTEYLQSAFLSKQVVMTFIGQNLRVMTLTTHCPISQVIDTLRHIDIEMAIRIFILFIKNIIAHEPRIAVCGINPHAGENGLIGNDEQEILFPILHKLRKEFPLLSLPLPADSVFFQAYSGKFDGVIAMYHDQALSPFKMIHFHDGVHITLGLPIIRTSPDHGTAVDIAGKNLANPQSMISAIQLASDLKI